MQIKNSEVTHFRRREESVNDLLRNKALKACIIKVNFFQAGISYIF